MASRAASQIGGPLSCRGFGAEVVDDGVDETAAVLGDGVKQHEFQLIIDALKNEKGKKKQAAERLGISPRTLRYKLAKMRDSGIQIPA